MPPIYCDLKPLKDRMEEKKWDRCCCDLCEMARRINEEKWIMSTETLAIINDLWGQMEAAETELAMLRSRLTNSPPGADYSKDLPDYGDLMSVNEFISGCESGCFTDYDGSGHPVREGKMAGDIDVYPSKMNQIPYDATHVMWFNK